MTDAEGISPHGDEYWALHLFCIYPPSSTGRSFKESPSQSTSGHGMVTLWKHPSLTTPSASAGQPPAAAASAQSVGWGQRQQICSYDRPQNDPVTESTPGGHRR
eukprot:CAMPEP_0181047216 /NCGR_PEP_ID=MMETSP1070-20121207/14759_1 /TAXON_ID=265543 /ORGANISM="Minutocellus polymorphus, Strain NH13" /LENGTH=103 /DNA_ID=CAMNT_0023125869 /DNA_START=69 /DNA_END=380 /DNA_ORIENTATION=-